jgi:hypothetical protein
VPQTAELDPAVARALKATSGSTGAAIWGVAALAAWLHRRPTAAAAAITFRPDLLFAIELLRFTVDALATKTAWRKAQI